jgi:hypothetical protein
MTFGDELGDLFDEGEAGKNADDLNEVMEHITHLMEDEGMPATLALEGLLNILKPGATDLSHDVMGPFRAAMFVQGHGEMCEHVQAVWFTAFPWGLGFHFGIEKGKLTALSYETKRAVIRALCAVVNAGGIKAEMTDNDRIKITRDDGSKQNIDIDQVVGQFREELEQELGPDAPTKPSPLPRDVQGLTDWLKRWMPDQ